LKGKSKSIDPIPKKYPSRLRNQANYPLQEPYT
jgi:hypothetical protein